MRAIVFEQPGDASVLKLGEVAAPVPAAGEVLLRVHATAVNRADVMQRRGLYPPPPGASPILGLEVAGVVEAVGAPGGPADEAAPLTVGQRVMALLTGGGYAELVAVPAGQVMAVPEGLSDAQAAAIPETFLTAFLNLVWLGGVRFPGESAAVRAAREPYPAPRAVLVHGGASGVGTAALQLCRAAAVRVICTVGDDDRAARCRELGADAVINYKQGDFVAEARRLTDGQGVDVVLDCIGGSYLERNLRALAMDGRLVCIGSQGGTRAELDLGLVLRQRLRIIGSTLRALPPARKAALVRDFSARALPLFSTGGLVPVVDRVLPLAQAADAHRALDEPHVGKIVLSVR